MKSLRLSLAVFAVIIVLWIKGDLDRLSDRRDSNDSSSLSDSAVSGAEIVVESSQTLSDTGPNGATDNLPDENPPSPPSPEINKPDRVIVVGRTRTEDTDWVINELPDWQHAIYSVDDPTAPLFVPQNKGKESNVYLQYIVDHYHDLPSLIVFLHSHRDGYPQAWHTEFDDHDNVRTVKMLRPEFVQRNGYANLRCMHSPGCPNEVQPFRPPDPSRPQEPAFPMAWEALFNNSNVPEVIAAPCCSQFAVSRDQVRMHDLSAYQRFQSWVLDSVLDDDVTGRVMEYMWHIIFGQDPVYCPPVNQCYRDVYGIMAG